MKALSEGTVTLLHPTYSLLRNSASGPTQILPGLVFLIDLWGRSLGIRPRSGRGPFYSPLRGLVPMLRLQKTIKKQAPEGFELDRKHYYLT